jgi:prolyl oligopeptidase
MKLVAESMISLVRTELWLRQRGNRPLYEMLRGIAPTSIVTRTYSPQAIRHSMEIACMIYPKAVLCLQHSVAITLVLRQHGFPAQLVIGSRVDLFTFHSWVVVGDQVINDKPYISEIYRELARC